MRLASCLALLSLWNVVAAFAPSLGSAGHSCQRDSAALYATKRRGAASRKSKAAGGFGKPATKNPPSGKSIYSLPALYDLAFGYRNYQEEVEFLLHADARDDIAPPSRILELAAGPARHSLTALTLPDSPVETVTAIDSSPEMVEYATQLAENEYDTSGSFSCVLGDMRQFEVKETFDSAWILLGSLQHLQTNEDVISCFSCVHKALSAGGTLILELPHPRETFSMVECTKNGWEVPLEDESGEECGELQIVWGDDTDTFDPIKQVRQFTVSFELTGSMESTELQSVRQVLPMRLFTAQEIDALARCSGFEVAAMYGALSKDVNVYDEDEAFRLVCVLRKTQ